MTHCTDCHRQLRNAPVMIGGLPFGPKCAKAAKATPPAAVDLFGFRPEVFAQQLVDRELVEIRHAAAAARRRLGVAA